MVLALLLGLVPLAYQRPGPSAGVTLVYLLVLGLALVWWHKRFRGKHEGAQRVSAVPVVLAAMLAWTPASAITSLHWVRGLGTLSFANADFRVTVKSMAIRDIVKPGGTVATVWAGAPGYYAERPMIDLLGKSDRRIARTQPKGPFRPGHNKWDYDISIAELRPAMVIGLWRGTRADYQQLQDWGYVHSCHPRFGPAFYLAGSDLVNWTELAACEVQE